MRLLADVAALRHDPTTQRQHLIDGLNRLIGTNQSFFYVAGGWHPGGSPHWIHRTLGSDLDPVAMRYFHEFGSAFPLMADPYAAGTVNNPDQFQTVCQADVMPDRQAQRRFGHFMDVITAAKVSDGVVAFHRTAADPARIVGVGMHNFRSTGKLRPRQIALVRFAMEELNSMNERGHFDLPPSDPRRPLPPQQMRVLELMLSGLHPKGIARELNLSIYTVREYIQCIYRYHKVSGRGELMAKCLRPDASPQTPANGDGLAK